MTFYLSVGRISHVSSQPKAKETAQRILDVAASLIHKMGYKAFSYRDIAKEVGIKTSSIHYHFPTKADLATALAKRWRSQIRSGLADIDASTKNPRHKVEYLLESVASNFRRTCTVCPCSMFATDFANIPEAACAEIRGTWSDIEEWLAGVLREGQSEGLFSFDGDPEVKAKVVFAAIEGATISAGTFQDPQRIDMMLDWLRSDLGMGQSGE